MVNVEEARAAVPGFSLAAFGLMVAGLIWMYETRSLFGRNAISIGVQVAAAVLMLAARMTFGGRSFHATARPTEGGIVSTGPYRYWRHPIYSAALYFTWAGALDHRTAPAYGGALLVTAGSVVRMLLEERLLVRRYPEYRDYMSRTKRVVPFLL
jgi:protein-S-isoprenylcysteine O-methyltransferase Ste14